MNDRDRNSPLTNSIPPGQLRQEQENRQFDKMLGVLQERMSNIQRELDKKSEETKALSTKIEEINKFRSRVEGMGKLLWPLWFGAISLIGVFFTVVIAVFKLVFFQH